MDSHYYCRVLCLPVLVVTRVLISSYLKLSVCSKVTFTLAPVTQFGYVLTGKVCIYRMTGIVQYLYFTIGG